MNPLQPNTRANTKADQKAETKGQEKKQHQPKPSDTKECPYCHAQVDKEFELCPRCGHKLVDYCTFCGASMDRNDTVCEECGMPAGGITCPKCGTLNMRSFCRKCDEPLNKAAIRAIEKAMQDPKVKKAAALTDKAAELEEKIKKLKAGKTEKKAPAAKVISDAERIFMEMFGTKSKQEEAKVEEVQQTESIEQLQEELNQVINDLNSVFESLVPPNGSTPQEQFGFFSAQKVAIERTRTITQTRTENILGWECNYCHCFHTAPKDCYRPQLGGTWRYGDITIHETFDEKYTEYKYEN